MEMNFSSDIPVWNFSSFKIDLIVWKLAHGGGLKGLDMCLK